MKLKPCLCVFLSLLFTVSLAGCREKTDPIYEQTIQYNLESEPSSLDPQIADDQSAQIVIMSLFEGLTRIGPDGEAQPGIAERWEHNGDYTAFTFYLREDACWTDEDETPVTAADFVFAFRRALNPGTGSDLGRTLTCIANGQHVLDGQADPSELGVTALDSKTLKIDLAYSYEDFPKLMASSAAMPCNEKFFTESQGQYGLEAGTTLGNGPYTFSTSYSWTHGESISLSRNSLYAGEQKPVPAGISFTIGAEIMNSANAIANGTVDAAPITGEQLEAAHAADMNLTSFEDTALGVCFNMQDSVFQNANIRSAFLKTLNRELVLSSLTENYSQAQSVIPPQTTLSGENYRTLAGECSLPAYEQGQGKAYLEAGLNELQLDSLPKVTILCLDSPGAKAIVNNLLENWNSALGYYLNLKAVSENELQNALRNGNYQLALCPLRADNDGPWELLNLFSSENPYNPAGYQNQDYNNLLSQIKASPGEDGAALCLQAENHLIQNLVFYPLVYEKRYFASAQNVTGIIFHPYNGGIDFIGAEKTEAEA